MGKTKTFKVQGLDIKIVNNENQDYISISDMAKFKDSDRTDYIIQNWLRLRDTVDYLGLWESLYNPNFNSIEFDGIRDSSGVNQFALSPKSWIEKTNAIGIISQRGRYGGTLAHKDIAFEFATWLSPVFKLWMIKEFQRLKEIETNQYGLEWDVKRVLAKVNYRLHTDAIKDFIIPKSKLPSSKKGIEYAKEADILNLALYGCTAKEWKEVNPELSLKGHNIRDISSINELTVLANMESINSVMIKSGISAKDRYLKLKEIGQDQLKSLDNIDFVKSVRNAKQVYPELQEIKKDLEVESLSDYNQKLKQALDFDAKKGKYKKND